MSKHQAHRSPVDAIDWQHVERTVANAVKNALPASLAEAYVAEPKPYGQVTEFVSQKTKEAHTALYQQHVETLNRVSAELDTVKRGEANSLHSAYASLKRDEARNANSVWLHELYFANCFDPHSEVRMDSQAYLRLERDFGTFDDWQKDYLACAAACGQGWAVCAFSIFLKRFVNVPISGDSNELPVGIYPLIVIDMHEHAYFKDYQTDKRSYVVAMMRELNWTTIEERFVKADAIHQVIK